MSKAATVKECMAWLETAVAPELYMHFNQKHGGMQVLPADVAAYLKKLGCQLLMPVESVTIPCNDLAAIAAAVCEREGTSSVPYLVIQSLVDTRATVLGSFATDQLSNLPWLTLTGAPSAGFTTPAPTRTNTTIADADANANAADQLSNLPWLTDAMHQSAGCHAPIAELPGTTKGMCIAVTKGMCIAVTKGMCIAVSC